MASVKLLPEISHHFLFQSHDCHLINTPESSVSFSEISELWSKWFVELGWIKQHDNGPSRKEKNNNPKNPLNPSECSHHLRLAEDSPPPRRSPDNRSSAISGSGSGSVSSLSHKKAKEAVLPHRSHLQSDNAAAPFYIIWLAVRRSRGASCFVTGWSNTQRALRRAGERGTRWSRGILSPNLNKAMR